MPAVTRVLPWRRHQLPAAEKVGPLVEQFRNAHPKASSELITRAYEVAEAAHEGQMRRSGEPYITHPLAVATIVAHFGLDETTIVSALLTTSPRTPLHAGGHRRSSAPKRRWSTV